MPATKISDIWKREHLGLTMILASLAVIVVTLFMLFSYQQNQQMSHIREQGTSLARVISRIPYENLVTNAGQRSSLPVLQHMAAQSDFAYVTIVDAYGMPATEITGAGVIIPPRSVPKSPSSWLGERTLEQAVNGRTVTEFYAPLLDEGEIAGHVRLGYFWPGLGPSTEEVPLLASFSLPIFMLTPLFIFLLRREVRPFREATDKLDNIVGQDNSFGKVELAASHELQGFMERFNYFMNVVQDRMGQLESDRDDLQTSTKLLGYKRARIESALQSFPEAIIVLDEEGIVSLANSRLENMVSLPVDRIVGHKPSEWCRDPEVVAFLSANTKAGVRGMRSDMLEFVPSGRPGRTLRVEPYPLFSPRDVSEILGTLVIFRDVTAEKAAFNSSGEFVSHLSHEMKTPLNVLSMYSESLLAGSIDDESLRVEAANVIHDEVERLAMLISNMLSISKIEMGSMSIERKRVKFRDLIQDAFDSCARAGKEKGLDFSINMPNEISPVALDKNLMRVAINNLLTNAIKYSDPGGAVSVSVEESEDALRVSVKDNGVGIAPEDQEKIFDKFFRSEKEEVRKRSGHGLGLSLAREIIQLHHGTLTVNSAPGEGSEFVIEFNKETNLLKKAV